MDPVDRLAASSGLAVPSRPAAIAAWHAVIAGAKRAWPKVTIDEGVLATFIGSRLAGADLAAALAAAPAGDLAIAAMCEAQDPSAHAAFDEVLTEVDAAGAT